MSEVSDAWQKGFETGSSSVRKLADKELDKLRAENEQMKYRLAKIDETSQVTAETMRKLAFRKCEIEAENERLRNAKEALKQESKP